jgi:hypothetical protein
MKKILFAFIAVLTFVSCNDLKAQSTSPRFGTTAGRDNTYRTLTNGYSSITDAAAADTVTLSPNSFNSYYRISLVDSLYMASPTITNSYAGDQITLIVSGASGKFLKFAGTNWQSAGTATLSSGLYAVIRFVFSGTKWVEQSRVVQ